MKTTITIHENTLREYAQKFFPHLREDYGMQACLAVLATKGVVIVVQNSKP